MVTVFMSHSSKDKTLARRIADDLVAANIDVWLDEWDILVGDSITQRIQHGLEEADFVAVLLTKHAVDSGWVEKEWQSKVGVEAATRKVVILPLKADDCSIPILLRDKRFADLRTNYTSGIEELVDSLKGHVSRHQAATLKYFHYISRNKVEMLLPQVRRGALAATAAQKVSLSEIADVSECNSRNNPELITQLQELVAGLEKNKLILDISTNDPPKKGAFARCMRKWRHGLFYFKGGVPTFWGASKNEELLILTVIYVAWTRLGDAIILLVGSPNNILGEKVAPEGVFMPGTGGVEESVRTLLNSLRTDEPIAAMREEHRLGGDIAIPEITLGSEQRYTDEYGSERMPLPGFEPDWFSLSLAQFCIGYLANLPEASIETIFRVLSTNESINDNFQLDVEQFADKDLEDTPRWMDDSADYIKDYIKQKDDEWRKIKEQSAKAQLSGISRVIFGSPIYTALAE